MSTSVPPTDRAAHRLNYAQPSASNLRQIAVWQRRIMLCILFEIGACWLAVAAPPPLNVVFGLAMLAIPITAAVFVFRLALSLFQSTTGLVLAILSLVPYLGWVSLVIINMKATRMLRARGVRVGLLGADPKRVPLD